VYDLFMKNILTLLFICISAHFTAAQDSLVVSQKNAAMFSNTYIFYSNGTFKHFFFTDDFQVWYGRGEYQDRGKTRILRFDKADENYKPAFISVHYEANFVRKLRIKKGGFKSRDYYGTTRRKNVFFEIIKTRDNDQ